MMKKDMVWLNIDHLQMGVGGDNTWGAQVHSEYTITPKEWSYGSLLSVMQDEEIYFRVLNCIIVHGFARHHTVKI
jgi:beta-galactosidase